MDITSDYLKANKYTLKCMCVSLIVMVTCWTLNVFKVFIIDQKIMDQALIGVIIFIALGFVIKFTLGFERPVSNYLMLFLFVGMITFVNMYISYHVTLFMVFPMACSILEFAPESSDVNGGGSGEAEAIEKAKKAGLNTEDGISFCGNDVPFYLEMLSDFVTAQPEKEKTLNECFANSDWKNYQIHMHALKSNLRSIGAEDLSELARTLEKAAEDEDVTLLKEKHGELINRYNKLASNLGNDVTG